MKEKNCLLAKGDIGKPKQSVYNLPTEEFVFGSPNRKEPHGVSGLTSDWQTHNKTT